MNDALPTPFDVKLMNMAATVLFTACLFILLAALAWGALRLPMFNIAGITVLGDMGHNNALTLRANVAPKLQGNFFTVDLGATRAGFEAVPWVRRAVVRREFPNRLRVTLQEHQAVAYWGVEGEPRLVNNFGEVFEANTGDVEAEDLPRLNGPVGQSALVLAMYQAVNPLFAPLEATMQELDLSARGGWRTQLDSGADIELGTGTPDEVAARTRRFVATLTQITSKYGRRPNALESADLRHQNGYAVRLRGVTTTGQDKQ